MTLLLILALVVTLAVLAPRYGVDSRDAAARSDGPPVEDKLWSRQP